MTYNDDFGEFFNFFIFDREVFGMRIRLLSITIEKKKYSQITESLKDATERFF